MKIEAKIQRLLECEQLLTHQTTIKNSLSGLEHGLMSLREAEARGIKLEEGLFGDSYLPHLVSLYTLFHNCFKDGYFASDVAQSVIIIDEKLMPQTKFNKEYSHPTFDGVISPDDLLAVVINTRMVRDDKKLYEEFVKQMTQRICPDRWLPIYLSDGHHDNFKGLYEWWK